MTEYINSLSTLYSGEHAIIKNIVGEDFSDQEILLAIDKAYKAILKYTGWSEFNNAYAAALIDLAKTYLNNEKLKTQVLKGGKIQTSKTQGSRSESYITPVITLDSSGLSEDVKAILPLPKLKVI